MALADEILALLPELVQPYSKGLSVKDVAAHFACTEANAHTAFDTLRDDRRAQIVRHKERGSMRRVVPLGHDFGLPGLKAKACWACEALFTSSNKLYCSKRCSASHRWTLPGYKERVSAAISAEHRTPAALERTAKHNQNRWSKPGEREKMSEQNKREWADPVKRAKRSASIQAVHGQPARRQFYSDLRKANWSDPEYYRMMQAKMIEAKNTPEFKKKFGDALSKRWQDPEMRPKFLEAARRNGAVAAERQRAKLNGPVSAAAQSVYDALMLADGSMTAREIEIATGLECNPVRTALTMLERHSMVVRTKDRRLRWVAFAKSAAA